MILLDANLLIYSKVIKSPQHDFAVAWFEQEINNAVRIGLPWNSLLAFLRIVTNPRIYDVPLTAEVAWTQVEEWLALPNCWVPVPTDQHSIVLGRLLIAAQANANLVPDAHLAALSIEHGLEVCTTDTDFAKFPGCRWRNPLLP